MLAYATIVVLILCFMFAQYCPCACTLLYRLYQLVMSRLRRPVGAPVSSRSSGDQSELDRVTSHFERLLATEAYFIESGKFKHVENVAILPSPSSFPPGSNWIYATQITPKEAVEVELLTWQRDFDTDEEPRLVYSLNENGTVNVVLRD